jgi:hypothetical protein
VHHQVFPATLVRWKFDGTRKHVEATAHSAPMIFHIKRAIAGAAIVVLHAWASCTRYLVVGPALSADSIAITGKFAVAPVIVFVSFAFRITSNLIHHTTWLTMSVLNFLRH